MPLTPITFTTLEALLARIEAHMTENHAQENTGDRTQQLLKEIAMSIPAVWDAVPPEVGPQFPPWDAGVTYEANEQVVVEHNGFLYLFVGVDNSLNEEPGTDVSVWQDLSALILAHIQGTDQTLDAGGPNEVTAQEIREHLDNPEPIPLSDVLVAGNETGPRDIRVTAGQAIGYMDGFSGGALRLLPVPLSVTDDFTLYVPAVDGTIATVADVAGVAALIDGTMRAPEAFTPTGSYPATYGAAPIQRGDSFRLGAGTMGSRQVNAEDLAIALVDLPGQNDGAWQVIESNRVVATQVEAEDSASTDLAKLMPPQRWWQAWTKGLTLASFASAVRGVVLTGYVVGSNLAVAATDSLLAAIQKLQGQVDARLAKASNLSDVASVPSARANLGLKAYATEDYAEALVRRVDISVEGTVAVGDVVCLNGDGWYERATPEKAALQKVGIVVGVNAGKARVQTAGMCTAITGLTVGAPYYLRDGVPGGITVTRPAAHAIYIGTAVHDGVLDLRPELPTSSGSVRLGADVSGIAAAGTDSGLLSKELEGGGIYEVKVYASVVAGTDAGRVNLWLVTEGAINGFSMISTSASDEVPLQWAQLDLHTAPGSTDTVTENQALEYLMSGILVAGPKDTIRLMFGPMNDGLDAHLKQGTILTWNRIG